jgi:AraC-like DNA-binding protein
MRLVLDMVRYRDCVQPLAAQRLQSPDSSVKEVAQEFGFSDPFNFSRVFKRIFGIPPGTFKNLR